MFCRWTSEWQSWSSVDEEVGDTGIAFSDGHLCSIVHFEGENELSKKELLLNKVRGEATVESCFTSQLLRRKNQSHKIFARSSAPRETASQHMYCRFSRKDKHEKQGEEKLRRKRLLLKTSPTSPKYSFTGRERLWVEEKTSSSSFEGMHTKSHFSLLDLLDKVLRCHMCPPSGIQWVSHSCLKEDHPCLLQREWTLQNQRHKKKMSTEMLKLKMSQ